MLTDFVIRNYRCFDDLKLEKLGRVNLITGKNNVGKSALLEAVRIWASFGNPAVLQDIVTSRNENVQRSTAAAIWGLLSGRTLEEFVAGPSQEPLHGSADGFYLKLSAGDVENEYDGADLSETKMDGRVRRYGHSFVPPNGIEVGEIEALWDVLALTDLEDEVTKSLQLLLPDVERVNLITKRPEGFRAPFVRIAGQSEPVPLKQLGDGMNRIFGIALALVAAKSQYLLIDEIENGIHYSVQERIWELIFSEATRLEVQVFATTHSWDCITAFQKAAAKAGSADCVLTRLESRRGRIVATQFVEEELEVVAREQIEVR